MESSQFVLFLKGERGPKCGRTTTDEQGLWLPESHDRRVVEVFLGRAFDGAVGFAGGSGGWKSDAKLIGEVQREAEILVHEAQRETGNVFPLEEIGRFDVKHTRASHAGLENFDELFALEAGARDESEGFGESIDLKSEDKVHSELDGLSGTAGAEMKDFFAHEAQDGLGIP